MALEIKVPRLGWNMEEGTFVAWLKRDGDSVQPGDPLFTLEGDKGVQDVEATDQGILRRAPGGPKEGDTVAVGTVLGYLGGEAVAAPAGVAPRRPPVSSPRARRAAKRLGVAWDQIPGTGHDGRVRERDVLAFAAASPAPVRPPEPGRLRRVIAERMAHSQKVTAPVTLTTTVDGTNLVNLRRQFQAAPDARDSLTPGVTDLFVKLAARALQLHPDLNARWDGDRPVPLPAVHIGTAVDTPAGLVVPVIRDVPSLTLRQVARRRRELLDQARAGRLRTEDLQGGTFTITNLGAYGVDAFTPIINWPECAILGLGRLQRRPAADGNRAVLRDLLTLSLTFDHRALDGAPAARFLQTLARGAENPAPWLLD